MADFTHSLLDCAKILLAGLLTFPFAINRERKTRIMGIRTFPLVGVGTCAIVILAKNFIGDGSGDAEARIIQGILSGIGFVGGGAILRNGDRVHGTECAAGIWVTGAIGISVAHNEWVIAVFLSLLALVVFQYLTGMKKEPDSTGT